MTVRTFYVEISAGTTLTGPDDEFEDFVDQLMTALLDEPGVIDADVGADLATGRLDFCLHLEAETSVAALRQAQVISRSAAHAAGAATPGWETVMRAIEQDEVSSSVRPAHGPETVTEPSLGS